MVWSGKIRRYTIPAQDAVPGLPKAAKATEASATATLRRKPRISSRVTDRSYASSHRVPRNERARTYSSTNTS